MFQHPNFQMLNQSQYKIGFKQPEKDSRTYDIIKHFISFHEHPNNCITQSSEHFFGVNIIYFLHNKLDFSSVLSAAVKYIVMIPIQKYTT